jgi:hypothetical protein
MAGDDNHFLIKADPTEAISAKLEELLKGDASGTLGRFLDLSDMALVALENAVDHAALAKLGPIDLMAGLDADLAAICVLGPN